MKLEELFTSIDLSVELLAAGLGEAPLFSYYSDKKEEVTIDRTNEEYSNYIAPAYTTDEVLNALPATLELGDDFYVGSQKFEPEIKESRNKPVIELVIEKHLDAGLYRYIASYSCFGKLGRVGISKDDKCLVLFGSGYYLPAAVGRLYLLLNEQGLINK